MPGLGGVLEEQDQWEGAFFGVALVRDEEGRRNLRGLKDAKEGTHRPKRYGPVETNEYARMRALCEARCDAREQLWRGIPLLTDEHVAVRLNGDDDVVTDGGFGDCVMLRTLEVRKEDRATPCVRVPRGRRSQKCEECQDGYEQSEL